MWFKCPNDGKHYNSDQVVWFQTVQDGSEYDINFVYTNSSNIYVQYNSTSYADQATAEAAIVTLLGSFASE